MFSLLLAAFPALSAANPELSSRQGDLLVRVERQVSVNDLQATVAALSTQMSAMQVSVEDGLGAAMVNVQRDATSRAIENAGMLAVLSTSMASVQPALADLTASVTNQLAAASATAAAQAAANQAAMDTALDEVDTTITDAIAGVTATVNTALSRQTVAAANTTTTLTALVASKADAKPKLWVGGCSRNPGSGWHWYCLNRETYNTAAGYHRKQTNDRMVTQRAGYFRTIYYTIKRASGWSHNDLFVNGAHQYHSYDHTAGCWWQDDHIDHTFKAQNNFWFAVRSYSNCAEAFHNGGAESGGSSYHSRITHYWVGPLE